MMRTSELVPHTSRIAGRIVAEVFQPDEAVLVEGDQTTARALLDLPFDHIFFTGSTAVGRKIMAASSEHLPSLTLELGGKSPVIVDETADIEHASRSIVWGKFVNAGQTCVAPDYAFVHESKAEIFFDAVRGGVERRPRRNGQLWTRSGSKVRSRCSATPRIAPSTREVVRREVRGTSPVRSLRLHSCRRR